MVIITKQTRTYLKVTTSCNSFLKFPKKLLLKNREGTGIQTDFSLIFREALFCQSCWPKSLSWTNMPQ